MNAPFSSIVLIVMYILSMTLRSMSRPINLDVPVYKIVLNSPNQSTFIRGVRSADISSNGTSTNGALSIGEHSKTLLYPNGIDNVRKVYQDELYQERQHQKHNRRSVSKEKDADKYRNSVDGKVVNGKSHFTVNNERRTKVHIADGAYPVYYIPAKTNGKFHTVRVLGRNKKLNKRKM